MTLDPHHRKLRSQGGDDSWGNQIRLPRDIHDLIHENPEVAYSHGMLVREHEDPSGIEPDLAGFLASVGYEGDVSPVEKKPRTMSKKGSEERRKRRRLTIAVPNDTENGGEVWDETQERIEERLVAMGLYEEGARIPAYEAWVAAANDWLNS